MSNYILYYRSRPSEPEADAVAMQQQKKEAHRIASGRHNIVGRYTEIESAPRGQGKCETRPALAAAYARALEMHAQAGQCWPVILRMDGIGEGDELGWTELQKLRSDGEEFIHIDTRCWTSMNDYMCAEWCQAHRQPFPTDVRERMDQRMLDRRQRRI